MQTSYCFGERITWPFDAFSLSSFFSWPKPRNRQAARRQRHVSERRIHAGRGHHTGAIGEKQILRIVRLIELIQDGSLGIAAHARRCPFVNRESGRGDFLIDIDVLGAGPPRAFPRLMAMSFDMERSFRSVTVNLQGGMPQASSFSCPRRTYYCDWASTRRNPPIPMRHGAGF